MGKKGWRGRQPWTKEGHKRFARPPTADKNVFKWALQFVLSICELHAVAKKVGEDANLG
jgi:hypothetical protein